MTATHGFGRAGGDHEALWRGIALRPIALRHEGFGTSHGLESDKKNDQVATCWRGFRRTLPIFRSIAIRRRPADPTWQSRWPKE
jgi:hypothetical protein